MTASDTADVLFLSRRISDALPRLCAKLRVHEVHYCNRTLPYDTGTFVSYIPGAYMQHQYSRAYLPYNTLSYG